MQHADLDGPPVVEAADEWAVCWSRLVPHCAGYWLRINAAGRLSLHHVSEIPRPTVAGLLNDLIGDAAWLRIDWGHSEEEALSALKDATQAYVEDMIEAGEELSGEESEAIEAKVVSVTV